MRLLLVSGLVLLGGCRCAPLEPEPLVVTPRLLPLGAVYVGQVAKGVVVARNQGEAAAEAEVSIDAPFSVEPGQVRVPAGASVELTVSFAALQPGQVSGRLRVGAQQVTVEARALEVPACVPTTGCAESRFDLARSMCVETPAPDGVACATSCLTGACLAGACQGQRKSCDDANACTDDRCDDGAGCGHALRVCPQPTALCRVASCDAVTGCGAQVAPDGTLCGPDDCKATEVDLCLAGACVRRARPEASRCTNSWLPIGIPTRSAHAMAYDAARKRVVLFGGNSIWSDRTLSDTWEWDGATWTLRIPATSPPGRYGHAMAYDGARQRVVLFGGAVEPSGLSADTWEWDGATWSQRAPTTSPPALSGHAMAYDAARQRVLLVGGFDARRFDQSKTWEWDGATWAEVAELSPSPVKRSGHTMASDVDRGSVVLFGGASFNDLPDPDGGLRTGIWLSDTWEWTSGTWAQRNSVASPSPRTNAAMTYDSARRRMLLFGGFPPPLADTWGWGGAGWTQLAPVSSPSARYGHAMADDAARQRVVLFGGSDATTRPLEIQRADTWEWDGAAWTPRGAASPPARPEFAISYDAFRQRLVLFGGYLNGEYASETWEWDGATWTLRAPVTSPPSRSSHALAYDSSRRRVVLFGGSVGIAGGTAASDTWEWDGATWTQRSPVTSPPARYDHQLAYDAERQRVVLFGGSSALANLADTWEWDGASWTQRTPAAYPAARTRHAMAYDAARRRVILIGGEINGGTFSDTWEWDGVNWTMANGAAPTPRQRHAVAYDPSRNRLVLFGGLPRATGNERLNDTWEWDGAGWTKLATYGSEIGVGQMFYDDARQRLTFFNGADLWFLAR